MTLDVWKTKMRLEHVADITTPIEDIKVYDEFWTSRVVSMEVPDDSQKRKDDIRVAVHEAIFIYVAVMVANRAFKVYYGNAERQSPEQISSSGSKLRHEAVARLLFPQLEAYNFIT